MPGDILTIAEVKHLLEKEQTARGELRLEQKLALTHADLFARTTMTKAKKLFSAVKGLGVPPEQAVKVADLLPRSLEELEPVFSKDRTPPEKQLLKDILAKVEEIVPEGEEKELPEPGAASDEEDAPADEAADEGEAEESEAATEADDAADADEDDEAADDEEE